jgi:hypothetical protein
VVDLKRCATRRRVISRTIAILGGIPRRSIYKIYCIRLSSSVGVRRRFFEIGPSFDGIPVIRRCRGFRGTSYAFAAAVGVENWFFGVILKG